MTPRIRSALRFVPVTVMALAMALGCSSNNTGGTTGGTGPGTTTGGGNCGTSGGFGVDCKPEIRVSDSNGAVSNKSTKVINSGEGDTSLKFTVVNNGNSPLVFNSVKLDYTAPAPEDAPALTCIGPDGNECSLSKFPNVVQSGGTGAKSVEITIHFAKPLDDKARNAKLHIATNDASSPTPIADFIINLKTASGVPKIAVESEVDLGFVKAPGSSTNNFTIRNQGTANLIIAQLDATALDDSFTLVIDGVEFQTTAVFDPKIDLAAGSLKDVQIVYKGKDDAPHTGDIILHTNDPSLTAEGGPGWKRVAVKVNSTGPCLKVLPTEVVFGGSKVGGVAKQSVTLKSCGDEAVTVTGLDFDATGAGNFAIDYTSIQATGGKAPSEAAPLTIPKNSQATFNVTYTPSQVADKAPDGSPVLDSAIVVVSAPASPNTPVNVTLTGFGSTGDCPTAVIQVLEGDAVVPQTVLHLDGSQSYSNIAKYKWSVEAPSGSVSKFTPSDTGKAVTFTPNVAGDYKFHLMVTDDQGKDACAAADKLVKVLPDQAIHVELLWHTPGDKDESDEGPNAGADLDLHFAHPYAATALDLDADGTPDPWFADQYDCFWYNCGSGKVLEWGSYDPNIDDNPHLDRDDTDGAGPENLNLTLPEDGKLYSVGVHYYTDHGFGVSTATVRIYVYGVLQYEDVFGLKKGDLWYVATVDWPSAAIEGKLTAAKAKVVTPNFPAPSF